MTERNQGRNRWPSLRKKTTSTSTMNNVMTRLVAVEMPENTVPAIASLSPWIQEATSLTTWLTSSLLRLSGGPCDHSCRRWIPSSACR